MGRSCEPGHREIRSFALIEAALREAGIHRESIDCIAVGLGPGSYGGIRTAIAMAQGWRLARGVKVMGFSSADCIAQQFNHEGKFTVVLDAQRKEFFGARYEKTGSILSMIEPFRLMREEDWLRERRGEPFLRPDVLESGPWWQSLTPDAAMLARLAAGNPGTLPLPLEPIYLRKAEFVKAPPPIIAAE